MADPSEHCGSSLQFVLFGDGGLTQVTLLLTHPGYCWNYRCVAHTWLEQTFIISCLPPVRQTLCEVLNYIVC